MLASNDKIVMSYPPDDMGHRNANSHSLTLAMVYPRDGFRVELVNNRWAVIKRDTNLPFEPLT